MEPTGQRRYPRFDVENLPGHLASRSEVRLLDVGIGGLAVETGEQLPLGNRYSLVLEYGNTSIVVRGVTRWCRLAHTYRTESGDVEPLFHAGLAFDEMLSDQGQEFLEHLEHDPALDAPDRVYGRFRAEAPEQVELSTQYDLQVEVLSLSGMLIGIGVPLKKESIHRVELSLLDETFSTPSRIVNLRHNSYDLGVQFHVGVEFIATPNDQLAKLQRYIDTNLAAAN